MKVNRSLFTRWCALLAITTSIMGVAHIATAEVIDRIVAVVGNDIITEKQLSRAMTSQGRENRSKTVMIEERQQVLDKMINDRLIDQLVVNAKVEVSEDDLAKAIANVLHQNGMTIEQLRAELARKGTSYDDYKKQVEGQIKRIKFVNQVIGPQVKISDQDLRDYYQRNQERFRGGIKAHIAQIYLPFAGITSQEEAEKFKEQALSISAKAKHGSFEEMARAYSKGPNAENGGDMGMVNVKDLPPQVGDVVRNMKIGDVVGPIPLENGLVLVKLVSLPDLGTADFEQLRDRIYAAMYDERIEETLGSYLQKERQKAFVEIR